MEELQTLLPQYEIESLIGRGGMGAVYRGQQPALERPIAIKLLPETLAEQDDGSNFVERFKLEAKSMAGLDHPAIISVHDFGQTSEGHLYFVMEFVDGMDMHKYIHLSGGSVDADTAVAIVSHVLDALDYAHSKGIVHRDIKPANVLINRDGKVKIADFGLAKKMTGDDEPAVTGLTMSNVALGTPDFIAPEALDSEQVADHRADLYAVGIMLYQMLTGKVPRGIFKLPCEENAELDPRIDDILTLAMEADPEGRFQSATEFRLKLDELASAPVEKIAPELPTQEVEAPAQQLDFTEPGLRKSESAKRHPARKVAKKKKGAVPIVWTVLGALAVGGLLFWWIAGSGEDDDLTGLSHVSNPVESNAPLETTEEKNVPEAKAPPKTQPSQVEGTIAGTDWPTGPHFSQEGGFKAWSSIPNDPLLDLSRLRGVADAKQVFIHGNGWVVLRENGETISSDGNVNRSGVKSIHPLFGMTFALLFEDGEMAIFIDSLEDRKVPLPGRIVEPVVDCTFSRELSYVIAADGSLHAWGEGFDRDRVKKPWKVRPDLEASQKVIGMSSYVDKAFAVRLDDGTVRVWSQSIGELSLSESVQQAVAGGNSVFSEGIRGFPTGGGPIRTFMWETGEVIESGSPTAPAVSLSRTTNGTFCVFLDGTVGFSGTSYGIIKDSMPRAPKSEDPLSFIRGARPGLIWVDSTIQQERRILWFDASSVPPGKVTGRGSDPSSLSKRIDGLVANGEWQDVLPALAKTPSYTAQEWTFADGTLTTEAPEKSTARAGNKEASIRGIWTEPLPRFEARARFTMSDGRGGMMFLLPNGGPNGLGFFVTPFQNGEAVHVGLHFGFKETERPAGSSSRLTPSRSLVGSEHEIHVKIEHNRAEVFFDGEKAFSFDLDDFSDWTQPGWSQFGVSNGDQNPMLGLLVTAREESGRRVDFHSFEIRIPEQEAASPTGVLSSDRTLDVPEFRTLLSSHQDIRRTQLSALLGKYRPALARAEEAAIAAGQLDRVEAVQTAIKRADTFAASINELPEKETVEPLPALPPLGEQAPDELKRLRGIFDTEVVKIERNLQAQFEKSLETLQSDLVKTDRIDEARSVERYCVRLSGGSTAEPSVADNPITEWTELFNGRDLSGWTPSDSAEWIVEGAGVRHRGDSVNSIQTTLPYAEFEMEGELLVSADGNGGLILPGILEMQLVGSKGFRQGGAWSGGLMGMKKNLGRTASLPSNPVKDGEWTPFRWRLESSLSSVSVNGVSVGSINLEPFSSGEQELMLQGMFQGEAGYRNLRVRPLGKDSLDGGSVPTNGGVTNIARHRPGENFPRAVASHTWATDKPKEAIDGVINYDPDPANRWSNYGSKNASDWLEIDFGTEHEFRAVDFHFFEDKGGVKLPETLTLETWNGSGWDEILSQKRTPSKFAARTLNRISFPAVRSSRVRVVFVNNRRPKFGITEMMVWDRVPETISKNSVGEKATPADNWSDFLARIDPVRDRSTRFHSIRYRKL